MIVPNQMSSDAGFMKTKMVKSHASTPTTKKPVKRSVSPELALTSCSEAGMRNCALTRCRSPISSLDSTFLA